MNDLHWVGRVEGATQKADEKKGGCVIVTMTRLKGRGGGGSKMLGYGPQIREKGR